MESLSLPGRHTPCAFWFFLQTQKEQELRRHRRRYTRIFNENPQKSKKEGSLKMPNMSLKKNPMPTQAPDVRTKNFNFVPHQN